MKKAMVKAGVFLAVFVLSVIALSYATNRRNDDMTAAMPAATLPVAYVDWNGYRINEMHGYTDSFEPGTIREHITPVGADRQLNLVIDLYGQPVTQLAFEVRSADGERLVEHTQVPEPYVTEDGLMARIKLKDLIEEGREYHLILLLSMQDGRTVRYATRIVKADGYHTDEKLDFIKYFHEKTFASREEAEEIAKYLESNAKGDNASFARTDIHSSFSQVTWGSLRPKAVTEPSLRLTEDGPETASATVSYYVSYSSSDATAYAKVEEYYRVRYTQQRMYLLEFERTVEQLFDGGQDIFPDGLHLGINGGEAELMENEGGNSFAFVNGGRLFAYNVTDNKLARVFSFYDAQNTDARTLYDDHDIRILNVDETGNVSFLVSGYMSRGRHEGRVGILVSHYDAQNNVTQEDAFIPYSKSSSLLQSEARSLSYMNSSGILYLMMENNVYAIDLANHRTRVVVSGLQDGSYQVSESRRMLVWQRENLPYASGSLSLMNLGSGKQREIQAGSGEYIRPLGFIGEDLIYGLAKRGEVSEENPDGYRFPMRRLCIEDEEGNLLKTYERDGIVVTDARVEQDRIILSRARSLDGGESQDDIGAVSDSEDALVGQTEGSDSSGIDGASSEGGQPAQNGHPGRLFQEAEEDTIMDHEPPREGLNHIETTTDGRMETTLRIDVRSTINDGSVQYLTPREALFEGSREMALVTGEASQNRYYVYAWGELAGSFTDLGRAVDEAARLAGTVLDDAGRCYYQRSSLRPQNQIGGIEAEAATEEKSSLAVCLDAILSLEGKVKNCQALLDMGQDAVQILAEALPDAGIAALSGCEADVTLYYLSQGIPVLAFLEEGESVLLIGYDAYNLTLMDPFDGAIYKKGMADSREWFAENGNRFVAYVREG